MSLADDLAELTRPAEKPCQVCHLLGETTPLDADTRSKFAHAIRTGIGAETLSKVMRRHGYLLPKQHVYDHRRDGHGA